MQLFSDSIQAHRRLSNASFEFLRFLENRPPYFKRSSFRALWEGYYRLTEVQPWPVFISTDVRRELEQATIGLDGLIKGIPERYFGNQTDQLGRFYNLDELSAGMLSTQWDAIPPALLRPDWLLTDQGFQCIEVNGGSHLDGWQYSAICESYLEDDLIKAFLDDYQRPVEYTSTTRAVLVHFIRDMSERLGFGPEVNFGVLLPDGDHGFERLFSTEFIDLTYRKALEEVDTGLKGRCLLIKHSQIEARGSAIYAQGLQLHGIFEQSTLPQELFRLLFRASLGSGAAFYSGLITVLLSDKRNLALLSDPAFDYPLSSEERSCVNKHLPWTRILRNGETDFRGEMVQMTEIVLDEKDNFVLKRGQSTKDNDIFIGLATPDSLWKMVVNKAVQGGKWIVQEKLNSPAFYGQVGIEGYTLQEIVFATFAVGGRYAGNWLRLMPAGEGLQINASRGAEMGWTLEVDET